MAKTLRDPGPQAEILARLDALTPDARARWGRLSVGQMVCHLGDVFEAQFEAPRRVHPGALLFRNFPLKHLALYVAPFPHGVRGPRSVFVTPPTEFARDVERAKRLTRDYVERAGRNGWPGHPYFGALDEKEWGYFTYKHADHHLRQFGV